MTVHLPHIDIHILNRRANAYILAHPLAFAWQVLKGFRANQGLLLAGAVAYYALLSIVPFLMLVVVVLSHFIDQAESARHAAALPRIPGAGPVASRSPPKWRTSSTTAT